VREQLKALIPLGWRRYARRKLREAPGRLRDLPRDAASLVVPRAFGGPIPPPGLRARVGGISRDEFAAVGRDGSTTLLAAFEAARKPGRAYPDWLDFGCGCGRLSRWMAGAAPVTRLTGVDVDAALIRWARRYLAGQYSLMAPGPPLPFGPESFDVVYAISIFTHLDEREQNAWLEDLRRVLRPGGLLLATTHGPELSRTCPGLAASHFAELERRGFLAVDAGGTFNERSSFHAAEYLTKTWGGFFAPRAFRARGFVNYQDLSVWEKPAAPR